MINELQELKEKIKPIKAKSKINEKKVKTIEIDRPPLDSTNLLRQSINNKLDLHGFTIGEAFLKIRDFIELNYNYKVKEILIITGKSGLIKKEIEGWLDNPEIYKFIKEYNLAPQNKGGEGAYIIELRSHR